MKPVAEGKGQATISSYFRSSPSSKQGANLKRSTPMVDLTISDEEDAGQTHKPAVKRSKTGKETKSSRLDEPLFLEETGALSPKHSTHSAVTGNGAINNYRFVTPSPGQPKVGSAELETADEINAKRSRHEAFKKKLLSENNTSFTRRKSDHTIDSRAGSESPKEWEESVIGGEKECVEGSGSHVTDLFVSKSFQKSKAQTVVKNAAPEGSRSKKTVEDVGPSGQVYTPLEKQVRQLKQKHVDTMLMIEVGYKYRFFGDDAKIASKELGIVCFVDRNFLTASIPTHRRDVHLKKLLSQGHKVGIVGQTETAALKKVSDNRNAPFERHLTHLYTAATFVDELGSVDDLSITNPGHAPPLICLTETLLGGMGVDERVSIGMIAVTPSTGDVVWDDFEDGFMRSELETRMAHIKPSEMILPEKKLSKASEKMLFHFELPPSGHTNDHSRIRIERTKSKLNYSEAFKSLSEFYTRKTKKGSENFNSGKLLAAVTDLPQRVCIALAHALEHLALFGLADALTQTEFFVKFTERQHMLLNANTLANLEIYRNQTDFAPKGSLMWVLDRTKTSFGARLLRSWVGKPLVEVKALQARVDAVDEILSTESTRCREHLLKLRGLLKGLPDLARGLCRIQYGKCTPKELSVLLPAFDKVSNAFELFDKAENVGFASSVLNDIIFVLPKLKNSMRSIMDTINLKKAAEDKRDELWTDPDKYPAVSDTQFLILTVESELEDQLKIIRKTLQKPAAQWTSVAGEEYLIEVKKSEKRDIPVSWHVVSSTKSARRYHTPEVKQKLQERAQHKERLEAEANKAYLAFLAEIAEEHYANFRNVVNKLAVADCLLSMATVASQDDYVKPQFAANDKLEIINGRHPMVEALRSDPFVPNSICLGGTESRTKIITGPNMGGKSSAVRMVALIALMAQIGSYVPASSVNMGLLDAILTRMGASDELTRGRSTFMVEMSETSDILQVATTKSLVILDELGRGSSTFDGMAIASAVLEHLVQSIRCKTLFITHYPLVAADMERKFPNDVSNIHMGFTEEIGIDRIRTITFLYRLSAGPASGSFGIECARLAGLSEPLLETATAQATQMQALVETKNRISRARKCAVIINDLLKCERAEEGAKLLINLRTTLPSLLVSQYI